MVIGYTPLTFEMHAQIQESKLALRRQMRERLAKMPEPQRVAASTAARELLSAQSVWKQAQSILFFAPLPGEPDLWPLVAEALAAGKTATLPRFDAAEKKYAAARIVDAIQDIRSGQFGIREPHEGCALVPLNQIDLVLVPGTAFDLRSFARGPFSGQENCWQPKPDQ